MRITPPITAITTPKIITKANTPNNKALSSTSENSPKSNAPHRTDTTIFMGAHIPNAFAIPRLLVPTKVLHPLIAQISPP